MSVEKVHFERRKLKRFKICSGFFAINSHFGLIDDISLKGLTFRYIERKPWSYESYYTGSLFGENDMWIDNIPIQHVSKSLSEIKRPRGSNIIKKRRIVFGELSKRQAELIRKFISINTLGVHGY